MAEDQREDRELLPEAVTVAIQNMEGQLLRMRQGELTNDEFRPNRTILGVYGQRQPEEYMIRVRIPYGGLTAQQLRALAQVVTEHGNGFGHLTTRQNMQLPWLRLDAAPEILRRLASVGLATLQAGGNSVRTVAACPFAGVCPKEAFDVTPYAQAVDGYYLGKESVMQLPRKFKAAFSGCPVDCGYAQIQDFGAVAQVRQEQGAVRRGFQVWVAGGLGVFPRLAQPLEEFVPEEELLPTCEAVLRVFDRLGDRKNKQKARLKFVLQRLGLQEFRQLVQAEREALRQEGEEFPAPMLEDAAPAPLDAPSANGRAQGAQDYPRWRRWNVLEERQQGSCTVLVPIRLGDVSAAQMEVVADLAERHGQGKLRISQQQDLVLRQAPRSALPQVYKALLGADLVGLRASGIANVTSCPGTSACSLGITASKGLARQLAQLVEEAGYQDDDALGPLRIKVSGCPDSCGQHYLADIGFYGCALHEAGRLYPAYQLLLGGEVTEGGTRLARPVVRLAARKAPQGLERLLEFYRSRRLPQERFAAFVDRQGLSAFRELLAEFTHVPPPREDIWNFIDWDSTRMYILERGEGECAV